LSEEDRAEVSVAHVCKEICYHFRIPKQQVVENAQNCFAFTAANFWYSSDTFYSQILKFSNLFLIDTIKVVNFRKGARYQMFDVPNKVQGKFGLPAAAGSSDGY
jgi:hypothetical protein